MKKLLFALLFIASVYGFVENATVDAATALDPVTVELIVKSHGADGSQFVLKGLQTPADPNYACTKSQAVADVFGDGKSVHFKLLGAGGVDQARIIVHGNVVGKLAVINDTYVDQSGNSIVGSVDVRQFNR